MRESYLQRVRNAARKLGEFSIDDLTETMLITTWKEKEKVRWSVKSLKRSGEAVSIRPGFYRYIGKEKPMPLIAKIWRAMRIKEYFTKWDLMRLSGASLTHVGKYCQFLERKGIIENSSGGRSFKDGIFCLGDPDKVPLEHPPMPNSERI